MVYWTEEDFKEIYGRYQESGLSIREFCNREGILEGRFHHWKKRLDKENGSHQFVPMKLNRHTGGLEVAPRSMTGNPRQQPGQTSCLCEIVYPNGVVLRINTAMSPENLRSLLLLK